MPEEIVNRVANSKLITINLADFYPKIPLVELDIKPWLYQGLIVKEQAYREHLNNHDWSQYANKWVCVHCSADAIIPNWVWMLAAAHLIKNGITLTYGNKMSALSEHYRHQLQAIDTEALLNKPLIVKGCGDKELPNSVYVDVMKILIPVAKSIMFGEPCSTVPIFKK